MFDAILQHRDWRTIRAEAFQPLGRPSDVVGLRSDDHPIHLKRLVWVGHKGRMGNLHGALGGLDGKPGHRTPGAQEQLMPACLLQ